MSTSIYNTLGLTLCTRMPNSMYMCTREVCKVKRVLFGPPDDLAAKKYVQEELAKITAIQSEKWNFDFKREQTLNANGVYQWRPATPQKTLRPVKVRPTPEEDLQEELYGGPREIRPPTPVTVIEEEEMQSPPKSSRKTQNQKPQRLITDFMVEKKRSTSDPTKKQDWAPIDRPAKVPRLNHFTTS